MDETNKSLNLLFNIEEYNTFRIFNFNKFKEGIEKNDLIKDYINNMKLIINSEEKSSKEDEEDIDISVLFKGGNKKIDKSLLTKYNIPSLIPILNNEPLNSIITYYNLLSITNYNTEEILNYIAFKLPNNDNSYDLFIKLYLLLNNSDIIFLYDTFDYKLLKQILNRDNFDNQNSYNKMCFIASIVFELWSLTNENHQEINKSIKPYFDIHILNNPNPINLEAYNRSKEIYKLFKNIRPYAEDYYNNLDNLIEDCINSNICLEIPKRNLDNIIKPIKNNKEIKEENYFNFNFKDNLSSNYTSSIIPKSMFGGDLKLLEEQFNLVNEDHVDEDYKKVRFLIYCIINSDASNAQQCINTLSISIVKIESLKVIETLKNNVLLKLAEVFNIRIVKEKEQYKVESISDWKTRINITLSPNNKIFNEKGELKTLIEGIDKQTYKKICIIHYIGEIVINTLMKRFLHKIPPIRITEEDKKIIDNIDYRLKLQGGFSQYKKPSFKDSNTKTFGSIQGGNLQNGINNINYRTKSGYGNYGVKNLKKI